MREKQADRERPGITNRSRLLVRALPVLSQLFSGLLVLMLAVEIPSFAWPHESDGGPSTGGLSVQAAQALASKLQTLSEPGPQATRSFKPVVISEVEANSYLRFHSKEFLPPGVTDPTIRITPDRVIGAANVNFEKFSQANSSSSDWGPKVLAAMFKGTQRFVAACKVQSENGQAKVQIESVAIGATRVPDWLVEFVVENYLQPHYKFDLSKPIPLPDHVTRLQLQSGQATFYRGRHKVQ